MSSSISLILSETDKRLISFKSKAREDESEQEKIET